MAKTTAKKKPLKEMRLGQLRATIWESDNERMPPKVNITKSYRIPEDKRENGDDGWRETTSLSPGEALIALKFLDDFVTTYMQGSFINR